MPETPDCDHDWNATSKLRLVVETGHELWANIMPMAPPLVPVEFCRRCGTLRVGPELLTTLNAAVAVSVDPDPSAPDSVF
jgi:hypothetical protein